MFNRIILMGRIISKEDPVIRTTPQGVPVISFPLAVDRSYTPKGEERKSDIFQVTAWRQQAEFISRYFRKRSLILIEGECTIREYTDNNNERRTAVEVTADKVSFTGERSDSYSQGGGYGGAENQGGGGYGGGAYSYGRPGNYSGGYNPGGNYSGGYNPSNSYGSGNSPSYGNQGGYGGGYGVPAQNNGMYSPAAGSSKPVSGMNMQDAAFSEPFSQKNVSGTVFPGTEEKNASPDSQNQEFVRTGASFSQAGVTSGGSLGHIIDRKPQDESAEEIKAELLKPLKPEELTDGEDTDFPF